VPCFLVETYLTACGTRSLAACEKRARTAAAELTRERTRVRFERSIYIPQDEICFFVFSAASRQDVARAAELAALDPIRVVEAISSGQEDQ
jgi:hypothetical protein